MVEKERSQSILREIDTLLKREVLPVSNDRLNPQENLLENLMSMKEQGLISGDLIRIGPDGAPHRMTNIRLTYIGIRALKQ